MSAGRANLFNHEKLTYRFQGRDATEGEREALRVKVENAQGDHGGLSGWRGELGKDSGMNALAAAAPLA